MSKLDEYRKANADHEALRQIILNTKAKVRYPGYFDGAHRLVFSFVSNADATQKYLERLAQMLAKACASKAEEIVAAALYLSGEDLMQAAQAAQAEAIETLQTIKVEKPEEKGEENHATETTENH